MNLYQECANITLNAENKSINEIVEYDPESNSFGFIEVFKWNPATDEHEFPGYMNTYLFLPRFLPHHSNQLFRSGH